MVTANPAKKMAAGQKKRLDALVFYAIDKASPYALAFDPRTHSLEKIKDYTLLGLSITEQGVAMMRLWINAHCYPDAKPVGMEVATKAKTVIQVRDAVYANVQ